MNQIDEITLLIAEINLRRTRLLKSGLMVDRLNEMMRAANFNYVKRRWVYSVDVNLFYYIDFKKDGSISYLNELYKPYRDLGEINICKVDKPIHMDRTEIIKRLTMIVENLRSLDIMLSMTSFTAIPTEMFYQVTEAHRRLITQDADGLDEPTPSILNRIYTFFSSKYGFNIWLT